MIGASLEAVRRFEDDFSESQSGGSFIDDEEEEESEEIVVEGSSTLRRDREENKEKQAISLSRTFALFVLCLTAVTVGHVVFFFLREDEHDDFRNSFHFMSREVAKAADANMETILAGLESLVTLAPLLAAQNGEILPFFTSDEWIANAAEVQQTTVLESNFYAPWLNTTEQIQVWESYALAHQFWLLPESTNSNEVWMYEGNETIPITDIPSTAASPLWQSYPVPTNTTVVNLDLASIEELKLDSSSSTLEPVVSELVASDDNYNVTSVWDFFEWTNETSGPRSFFFYPIPSPQGLVGHVGGIQLWENFFDRLVSEGDVTVVVEMCDEQVSYQITEQGTTFMGYGDLHEAGFESMELVHTVGSGTSRILSGCVPVLHIFPTAALEEQYSSDAPILFTGMVAIMFAVSIFLFILYDKYVRRRQDKVEREAHRTEAIVSQLFPGRIREMVIQQDSNDNDDDAVRKIDLDEGTALTKADFFPDVTLMFADIVGFTAWSSLREPQQVFLLLESTFSAFDEKARHRGIFKIETVGDCYVAAAGLPNYRKDHAVAMSRFARDCLTSFRETVAKLATSLGHDTLELGIRFGVHSGPVTAGVLRGERARFQLFGDTMNTCARLESTSMRNRIQISEQTAGLLREAGKETWFAEREDVVEAKGKGVMKTYWLRTRAHAGSNQSHTTQSNASSSDVDEQDLNAIEMNQHQENDDEEERKTQALIDWNVETLASLLKPVVMHRNHSSFRASGAALIDRMAESINEGRELVVEEVAETIQLPEFDINGAMACKSVDEFKLDDKVMIELRQYVTVTASMYRKNAFHNFEHATNVALAMRKLLSRIVAPKLESSVFEMNGRDDAAIEARKHDHTYGITSDPLTQFAVVFSALIHDVDHRGISNGLLAKEDPTLAGAYKSKSIAEQNSVDVAWFTLMSPDFANLRSAIFANLTELRRFRQLLVNAVIATDIFDKEQGTLRKTRWTKAFSVPDNEAGKEDVNRKATIVIEHLIQASDVSHTMAHWVVYQKWNERLFKEQHDAFTSGRSDSDPSKGWYKGELWFFDNYVIPLTKKLKDCGVFGVSSDEYLKYASANREEWELTGEAIVADWTAKYNSSTKKKVSAA